MTDGSNDQGGFSFPTPTPANPPSGPTGFPPSSPLPPGVGVPPSGLGMPPGTTPPKKRGGCLKIVLILFVLGALLVGGCTAFVYKTVKGAADAGNKFVAALHTSAADAEKRVCDGAITGDELEQLRTQLTDAGWTGGKTLRSSSVNSSNGNTTGEVSGTVTLGDGTAPISLSMRKSGGSWCVAGIQLGSGVSESTDTEVSETTVLQ